MDAGDASTSSSGEVTPSSSLAASLGSTSSPPGSSTSSGGPASSASGGTTSQPGSSNSGGGSSRPNSSSQPTGPFITGITPRLYPANPLPAGTALAADLDLSDGNQQGITWSCTVDRRLDGVVTPGPRVPCTSLPGAFTLDPQSGVLSWRTPLEGHGAYELTITAVRSSVSFTATWPLNVRPDYPQVTSTGGALVLDVDTAFATGTQPAWGAPLSTVGGLVPGGVNGDVMGGAVQGFVGDGTAGNAHRLELQGDGWVVFPAVVPATALVTGGLQQAGSGTAWAIPGLAYRLRRPAYSNVLQLETGATAFPGGPSNSAWTNLVTGEEVRLDFFQGSNSTSAGWQNGPARLEFNGNERVQSSDFGQSWSSATLEVWMRADSTDTSSECFLQLGEDGYFGNGGEGRLAICRDGASQDQLYYKDLTRTGDQARYGPTLAAGLWHHVVLVFDGLGVGGTAPTLVTAYLNGQAVGIQQPSVRLGLGSLDRVTVGSQTNNQRAVDGAVARARVWRAALGSDAVTALFQDKPEGSILDTGAIPNADLLQLYWDARLRRPCRAALDRSPGWVVASVTTSGTVARLGIHGREQCTHTLPGSVATIHGVVWGAAGATGVDGWSGALGDLRAWDGGANQDAQRVFVATGQRLGVVPDVSQDGLLARFDAALADQFRIPEDGCGDTGFVDTSGHNRHLSMDFGFSCNAEGWSTDPLPALHFSSAKGTLAHDTGLGGTSVSLELLYRPNAINGWRMVLGKTDDPWTQGYALTHNDPDFSDGDHPLTFSLNDHRNPGVSVDMVPGQWVHLVATADASGMLTVYRNSYVVGQATTAPLVPTSDAVRLGRDASDNGELDAAVAYSAIYDRALAEVEVVRHCQAMQLKLGGVAALGCLP